MPPNRYGHQSMNAQYAQFQPSYLQHHPVQPQHGGLPPPNSSGGGFGPGNGAAHRSPFAVSNAMSNGGFDRILPDGLGGHGAQGGFVRGGPVQQLQLRDYDGLPHTKEEQRIRDVWKNNLAAEMQILRQLVEEYPYIAMDTEFPGIVARPIGQFTNKADYHYQTLRCNVDLLKMIQLGITLFAPDGSLPPASFESSTKSQPSYMADLRPTPFTWQFNFKFSLSSDMYAAESTSMLSKAGIDFSRHETNGIDPLEFGALLISSGLVLVPDVHWISFHSGYDFAYLMKMMLCQPLPDNETNFHDFVRTFFPSLFDIKFILKHTGAKNTVNNNQPLSQEAQQMMQRIMTKAGLQDIAEELAVSRIGQAHQAGSDSLLTGQVYFKMREKIFNGQIDESVYSGQVWGLNAQMPNPGRDLSTPNMNGATFYNHQPQHDGGAPSTPQTGIIGLTSSSGPQNNTNTHTPVPQNNPLMAGLGAAPGNLTPGGQFGKFQYSGMG